MKKLLLPTVLVLLLSLSVLILVYLFISPVAETVVVEKNLIYFLTSLFGVIASFFTLLLYFVHSILKRRPKNSFEKAQLGKGLYLTSLRRGVLLGLAVIGGLLLQLWGQGGWLNTSLLAGILLALELFWSLR